MLLPAVRAIACVACSAPRLWAVLAWAVEGCVPLSLFSDKEFLETGVIEKTSSEQPSLSSEPVAAAARTEVAFGKSSSGSLLGFLRDGMG